MMQLDLSSAKLLSRQMFQRACTAYMNSRQWQMKSIGQYERQLWSACLNFFRGDVDAFGFIDLFADNIQNQLTRAWNEGARSVGVEPKDMEQIDLEHLHGIIDSELNHVLGIAQDIEDAINDGMTIDQFRSRFRSRIDLWVNRYNEVINEARVYFGDEQKLVWQLGATEEHCETCSRLNGIVAYAREWDIANIKPQNPPNGKLECGGWNCDCSLEPTDKRRSPNALTRLLDIAMSRAI